MMFQTPLHLAIVQNNPLLMEELLRFKASPLATTSSGDNCYHLGVKHGDVACLRMVLKHFPNRPEINLLNDQGKDCRKKRITLTNSIRRPNCSPSCSVIRTTHPSENVGYSGCKKWQNWIISCP